MAPSSHPIVKPTILGKSTIDERIPLDLDQAKWISLELLKWTDQDGKKRGWEMAKRNTTSKGGVDAVAIAAILRYTDSSSPTSIPIILQYRPPVGKICVELPAGLIDESETPEQAGVRELYEETGYGGPEGKVKVVSLGGVVPSDPGMSSANMHLLTVDVEIKASDPVPVAKLEPGEHIEVRVTPLASLYEHLEEYEKLGYAVDARLHHFAAGIHTAKRLGL